MMALFHGIPVFFVIGCLLLGSARADGQPRVSPAPAALLREDLDRAVLRADLGRFWGAVLVARKGEVILAKGYGYANDNLDPITADSLFDIGSISKMFTAATILKLEASGKLSLDDTISKFFPDSGAAATQITIRQLLSHTSGKSDRAGAIQPLNFEDRDDAVRRFVKSRSSNPSGEAFEYCNGGYVVLAAIVEVAAGKPFEESVRELVLKPAGMNASGFLDGVGLDASRQTLRAISGQYGQGSRRALLLDKRLEPWAWGLRGAGGLVTSANDLLAWDNAIRAHAVLSTQATTAWTTPVKSGYAFGWEVSTDDEGRTIHRHGGATRGYRCDLLRYPDDEIVIAVLSGDSGTPPAGISEALARTLFPAQPSRTTATFNIANEKLNQFRAVVFDEGLSLTTTAKGKVARLELSHNKPQRTLAVFDLEPGAAKKVAAKLRSTLESDEHKAAEGGIKGGIYLYQYADAAKAGKLVIDDAGWTTTPGYRGRGEKGEVINDDRLVLILLDPQTEGAWPTMLHLDDAAAARLATELEKIASDLAGPP